MDTLVEELGRLWAEAADIWVAGGWGMLAIAVDALVLFALGCHVHLRLRERRFLGVSEETLREWVAEPGRRRGPVGELLDQVKAAILQPHVAEAEPGGRKVGLLGCRGAPGAFGEPHQVEQFAACQRVNQPLGHDRAAHDLVIDLVLRNDDLAVLAVAVVARTATSVPIASSMSFTRR